MKTVLSKGIISVDSNRDVNHGFLYGSFKNKKEKYQNGDISIYNVKMNEVNDEEILISDNYNKKDNYYYKNNCSIFSRKIPLIGDMRIRVEKLSNGLSVDYGKNYRRYSEFILFRRELPERIASIFSYWGLLEKNIISLHCSAVHKNGRTLLIFAPPDTGKTQTAINLVTKCGWKFISDDIVLSNGREAYAVPYTRSGVWEWDRKRLKNKNHPFSKRTKKSRIYDYLKEKYNNNINEKIEFISYITDIFIIEKGTQDLVELNNYEAVNTLYAMNSLEFHNIGTSHFWYSTSLSNMFNMHDLKTRELNIISQLVDNSNSVNRLKCEKPDDFYSQIESLINSDN